MTRFTIFVSSPSDVAHEREIARKVIQDLHHEFISQLAVAAYFWEYEPMDFGTGYQPQIDRPSEFDVLVCIFWSRLGTPVDMDGVSYPSGSAYELLVAKESRKSRVERGETPSPHILVFTNSDPVLVPAIATADSRRKVEELERLHAFLDEQTRQGDQCIGAINAYADTSDFESKLESKLRSLMQQRAAKLKKEVEGRTDTPGRTASNPYRGLYAFEFQHADVFFGRRNDTSAVIKAFRRQASGGHPCAVTIVGASGSGKSSLARAGVMPMLMRPRVIKGADLWRRAQMKPREMAGDLFLSLAAALLEPTAALPELARLASTPEELAARLRASPQAGLELIRAALKFAAVDHREQLRRKWESDVDEFERQGRSNDAARCRQLLEDDAPVPSVHLVLLIDQLEELFTGSLPETARLEFTAFLRQLAEADEGPVFLLMTISTAFQGMAAENEHLRHLAANDGTYHINPPSDKEFAQMIRLPALAAGLQFEEERGVALDAQILLDAKAEPDCLPLVEFCLEELTNRCRGSRVLTFKSYRELGTISGVLSQRADETLKALSDAERAAIDVVLAALINRDPNQPGVAVRRIAAWDEIAATPESEALVRALVGARLLVVDADAKGTHVVSVVHEALLRHWEPAKTWIKLNTNQDFLRRRERLEQSFRLFSEADPKQRRQFLIPSGIQLVEAQHLLKLHPHAVARFQPLIAASVRKVRRQRVLAYCGIATALLLAFGAYWYNTAQQVRFARSNHLMARAEHGVLEKDFSTAEINSAEALTLHDSEDGRRMLLRARSGGVVLRQREFHPHGVDAGMSAVSRDGSLRALTAYDANGHPAGLSIAGVDGADKRWMIKVTYLPECIAFTTPAAHDGRIAIAEADHTIGVWELPTGEFEGRRICHIKPAPNEPGRPTKRIPCMAFHPRQPWLAVCSDDMRICLWDYSSKPPRLLWERKGAHSTATHGIAFNDNGSMLASGGGDYKAKVWKLDDAIRDYSALPDDDSGRDPFEPLYELSGHTDSVFAVAFSPNGEMLASGGYDRLIRIWNLKKVLQPVDEVTPDDTEDTPKAASSSQSRVHPMMMALTGHSGTVLDLAFSRDNTMLASGGKDGTARLWHVLGGGALIATLRPECGEITSVSLASFQEKMLCAGERGWSAWTVHGFADTVKLWNEGAAVGSLAFDPAGKELAVGGDDGKIRVFDRSYRLQRTLDPGFEDVYVNGVAFSPDGRWLTAGGDDGQIFVWDRLKEYRPVEFSDGGRPRHEGPVWGLCFSHDSDWLVSSNARDKKEDSRCRIRRWDIKNNWKKIEDVEKPLDHHPYALAIHPQSRWVASGDSDAWVCIREVGKFNRVKAKYQTAKGGENNIWSLALCPKPLCLFSGGSDGHVHAWLTKEDQKFKTSPDDAKANPLINSVSYNHKLGWIAAGGDGATVEVYDRSLRRVLSIPGQEGTVWMVAFDPQGERLAIGGGDRFVRVWNVADVQRLLSTATPAELYAEVRSRSATAIDIVGATSVAGADSPVAVVGSTSK